MHSFCPDTQRYAVSSVSNELLLFTASTLIKSANKEITQVLRYMSDTLWADHKRCAYDEYAMKIFQVNVPVCDEKLDANQKLYLLVQSKQFHILIVPEYWLEC